MKKLTANDPETRSTDVLAGNIEQLKALFPEVVTQGRIDFDVLKQLLRGAVDEQEEKYGLNWVGKRQSRRSALATTSATLRPCKELSVNWDVTRNVFIEGDSLVVLKALQRSYHRKVKLVYVEPPYNTGRDGFYPGRDDEHPEGRPDTLTTYLKLANESVFEIPANSSTSGRYHTAWLNMMYPRLFLARSLLCGDGYLIACIDDSELKNLTCLLDEIFGEENRLAVLVIDRSRKNDAKFFSVGHEYIIVYARDKALLEAADVRLREPKEGVDEVRVLFDSLRAEHRDNWSKVEQGIKQYYKSIPKDDPREPLKRFTKVDARGPFRTDGDISWPGNDEGPRYDVPHPSTGLPCRVPSRGWVYPTYERMAEEMKKGTVFFGANEDKIPSVRRNLFDATHEVMGSVWSSYSQTTTQELKRLFENNKVFDNPKDPNDLKRLVDYLTGPSDTIVDLFTWSGSLAHAVLLSNVASGCSRRFISIQLPETIKSDGDTGKKAREFCRKHGIRPTVSALARARFGRAAASLASSEVDSGFRLFRLDRSNVKPWSADATTLDTAIFAAVDNIEESSTDEDILFEVLLKFGLDLTTHVDERKVAGKRVFVIGAGAVVICLERLLDVDVSMGIAAIKSELNPAAMRVVFVDSGFPNDVVKTNIVHTLRQAGIDKVRSI